MTNCTSCQECKDRQVGCHGTCEKYSKWAEEYKKEKTKIMSYLSNTDYRDDHNRNKALRRMRYFGDTESKRKYHMYSKNQIKRS